MRNRTRMGMLGAAFLCTIMALELGTGTLSFAKSGAMHDGAKAMADASVVASVSVNKTAQMVEAAPGRASRKDEATFILTAKLADGRPAAREVVTYYIGPMKPLSNVSPKAWIVSGSKAAADYIAHASVKTDAQGKATLVLLGQPTDSMEMIGVRVGNLTSYSTALHRATASLDAWWTTARSHPTAPVGDYVTVSPFLATSATMTKQPLMIGVYDAKGQPVAGAHVSVSVKASASMGANVGMSGGMSGMAMGGGMGMSANAGIHLSTNMMGRVMTEIAWPAHAKAVPVRIVVTQPSGGARVAGGMNIEYFAK